MKFLFNSYQSFAPKKFGGVVFENKIDQKEVKLAPVNTHDALDTVRKDVVVQEKLKDQKEIKGDLKKHSESVESLKLKEAEVAGNKLLAKMASEFPPASEAQHLTPVQYGQRIDDIGQRFAGDIEHWRTNYAKALPNGWMDNIKIGGVVAAVAFGSKEGGMIDRSLSAAKWGGLAAMLAHPMITGGVAGIATAAGREVFAPGVGVMLFNFVIGMVADPGQIVEAFKKSNPTQQASWADTPIFKLLGTGKTESQTLEHDIMMQSKSVMEMRGKNLRINDTGLNNVMNAIALQEKNEKNGIPSVFDGSVIPDAANFLLQSAEYKLGDEQFEVFRLKLSNNQYSSADIRHILASNANKEVFAFFEKRPALLSELKLEMGKQKVTAAQNNMPIEKADLNKMFIDGTAQGGEGFAFGEKKLGVRRFMSMGIGGSALTLYAISFLLVSGIMKMQDLAQPSFWKEKLPKAVKAPFKWTAAGFKSFGKMFKKAPMTSLADLSKKNKWSTKEQRNVIRGLDKDDKKTVTKRFEDFKKTEKKTNKEEWDKIKKSLKGKDKRTKKREILGKAKMTPEQFKSLFDGVSADSKQKLKEVKFL